MLRCLWLRNAPEWFDTEIPKGKIYELYSDYMIMRLYLICVELPDSNDVIVNIEGLCFDRTLVPKLINSEDANDLKLKDGRKQ